MKSQITPDRSWKRNKPKMFVHPVTISRPFQEQGLDIIYEIIPNSTKDHKYIITTTNYFTQ